MTDIRRVETLMRGHEARPYQAENTWASDWYLGPFLTTGHRMHTDAMPGWYSHAPFPAGFWNYLLSWFWIAGEENPANPRQTLYAATNVRVQTRNIRLFIRRSSWTLAQTQAAPGSDNFSYTLRGAATLLSGHRFESESNGGGTSHPILDGARSIPHGYGIPYFVADPWSVTGIAVDMDVRLILDNPAGVDDRAQARAVAAIACDLYYNQGSPTPAVGYWPAIGAGGYARITNDWQRIGFNTYFAGQRPEMGVNDLRATYNSSLILADPPPGWTDGGSPPVPDPTPQPQPQPIPAAARRLLFIGDDYVRGNEDVAGSHRSWRGRALSVLAGASLTVDAIGREVLASEGRPADPEHDGYAGARISTTANNIAARLDAIFAGAGGTVIAGPGVPGGVGSQIIVGEGRVDAAVLMLGLSDYESEPTGIADRYSVLFNSIRSALPTTNLAVVTLPPRQGLTEAGTNAAFPGYAALNARIRQIAATTYGVQLADVAALPFVSSEYQSPALLLQAGANRAGDAIAEALRLSLGGNPGYILPGAPTRPVVSLRTVSSLLHVFRRGITAQAPAIVSTALPQMLRGEVISHTVQITGSPVPAITITGLPPGLSHTGALISGTTTAPDGDYSVTVQAVSEGGSVSRVMTLRLVSAPVITTNTLPPMSVGTPVFVPLVAMGAGPFVWSADGLPAGLIVSGNLIVGPPSAAFSGTVTLRVSDANGQAQPVTLALTVTAPFVAPPEPGIGWQRIERDTQVWVRVPRDS